MKKLLPKGRRSSRMACALLGILVWSSFMCAKLYQLLHEHERKRPKNRKNTLLEPSRLSKAIGDTDLKLAQQVKMLEKAKREKKKENLVNWEKMGLLETKQKKEYIQKHANPHKEGGKKGYIQLSWNSHDGDVQDQSQKIKLPDSSSRGMGGTRVEKITTTTTAIDDNQSDGLPTLVLHIGPHKTATSTIQCALTRHREQLFTKASLAYLGRVYAHCKMEMPKEDRFDTRILYHFDTRLLFKACFETSFTSPLECKKSKDWKNLESKLEYFSGRNKSVLLSDEIFVRLVDDNLRMFYELLNKYYPGRVRVVMTYRRYFEWCWSKWNSDHKPYENFITDPNNPYRIEFQNWPEEGGQTVTTFLNYITSLKERGEGWDTKSAQGNLHPVEYLRSVWTNHTSSQIMLLNIRELAHDGEDLVTGFLREIFPSPSLAGDTFAKAASEDSVFAGRPNPSRNIDYDRLAVAARQQGLLTLIETTPRFKVTELAEKHLLRKLNTTIDRLPRICPDKTLLQELLNNSLEYEHRVYPDQWSEESSGEHRSAFLKAEGQGKFCHMDVDKIIEDDAVQEFFTTDIVTWLTHANNTRKERERVLLSMKNQSQLKDTVTKFNLKHSTRHT